MLMQMNWFEDAIKVAFHIADAPAPARSTGSEVKDGEKLQNQMKELIRRNINFTFIKTNDKCDKMIDDMKTAFNPPTDMGLIDLYEPPEPEQPSTPVG